MAELRDILEGSAAKEWMRGGVRFRPIASVDVPTRSVFLNSDLPNIRLCFKDGNGNVFKIRMQAI